MNPVLARLLVQLALDPEKLLRVFVIIVLGFLMIFVMVFAVPIVMFKSVPLATPAQFNLYVEAAKQVQSSTGVTVDWQQLVAIDAVLLDQNFTKASTTRAVALANRFVRTEVVEEARTTTDEHGVSHTEKVKVVHHYLRSFDEVLNDLVREGSLASSQIEDIRRYTAMNMEPLLKGGGTGGVPLPPHEITENIRRAIEIVGQTIPEVDPTWQSGMEILVMRESGGNPSIVNPELVWYSSQWGFQQAKGLCQMMPPTFERWKLPGHDDIFNPVDNLIASLRYIQSKYGSVYNIQGIQFGEYGGY